MKPRIPHLIGATVSALLAAALIAGGIGLLWLDGKKDDQGFVTTGAHTYTSSGSALVTENLDIDLDGGEAVFDADDDFGSIRLKAESEDGRDLFVGIAPTKDVGAYLRGVAHTEVADVDYEPFDPTYREREGRRRAKPPAEAGIWAASTHGRGDRDLVWEVEDGDWSVVVMNADGSAGVDAEVDAGAKIPYIDTVGWAGVGAGGGFALLAATLFVLAFRRRREPSDPSVAPTAVMA